MPASAILLLSGGLDSTVSAALARRRTEPFLALTFDYGQRAAAHEVRAAEKVAHRLQVPLQVIALPWLEGVGAGALVDKKLVLPQPEPEQLDDPEAAAVAAEKVWVPNRNGLFLNIAACFADAAAGRLPAGTEGPVVLVTGFNAEEAATFPDNSKEFALAAERAFTLSTREGVRVKSFTQEMDKAQIVATGLELGVVFEELWSCYEAGYRMCGRCESCRRAQRAYHEAGIGERMQGQFEAA